MDLLFAGSEIRVFRTLAQGAQAGLPLPVSLEAAAEGAGGEAAQMLRGLASRVGSGMALSEAMRRYPDVYLLWQRGIIQVGEETGRLDQSFSAILDILEERRAFWLGILPQLGYPLLLITVGPIILSAPLLVSRGPAAYLAAAAPPLLLFYGCLVALAVAWKKHLRKLELWRRMPAFARFRKAQFCLYFAGMVRAGLSLPRALELAGSAAGLDEEAVRRAAAPGNETLVERLERLGVFSGKELGELKVGELTGETPLALERILRDARQAPYLSRFW